MDSGNGARGALASLKQLVRTTHSPEVVCELCAAPLNAQHDHLLELDKHRVVCACRGCTILFDGHTRQPYRRIPPDVYSLPDFAMEDYEWESLLIPIDLAFFVYNSAANKTIALYPSPAGMMESSLDLESWNVTIERNPVLSRMQPDVEALLVNRIGSTPQYFRVPIDCCFWLVGLIRMHWRGLSGGSQVWQEIDRFFADLARRSGEEQHARPAI